MKVVDLFSSSLVNQSVPDFVDNVGVFSLAIE